MLLLNKEAVLHTTTEDYATMDSREPVNAKQALPQSQSTWKADQYLNCVSNLDPSPDSKTLNKSTKKRQGSSVSRASSPAPPILTDPSDDAEIEPTADEVKIYEQERTLARARYPDPVEKQSALESDVRESRSTSNGSSSSQSIRQQKPKSRTDLLLRSSHYPPTQKTTSLDILLTWETRQADGASQAVLSAHVVLGDPLDGAKSSIIWQHSDWESAKVDDMSSLASQLKQHGLEDSELGLTKQLLKEVQDTSQHAFVGGSFLSPTASRHDLIDNARYGKDRSCVFINFSYFTIHRPQTTMVCGEENLKHPTRTLFQSRYRLNWTKDKDRMQCIRMLKSQSLKSCIECPESETSHLSEENNNELIHVPQLWAMIIGRKHVVTLGPIGEQALQKSLVTLNNHPTTLTSRQSTVVKISFRNYGTSEEVTYSIEQCASWFELLNKHQEFLKRLLDPRNVPKTTPRRFCLRYENEVLIAERWALVQRGTHGVIGLLSVEAPEPNSEYLELYAQEIGNGGDAARESPYGRWKPKLGWTAIAKVPVTKAFLAWRVVDDFDEAKQSPVDDQIERFLGAIHQSLVATYFPGAAGPKTHETINRMPGSGDPIIPRTRKDVEKLAKSQISRPYCDTKLFYDATAGISSQMKKMRDLMLLDYFGVLSMSYWCVLPSPIWKRVDTDSRHRMAIFLNIIK